MGFLNKLFGKQNADFKQERVTLTNLKNQSSDEIRKDPEKSILEMDDAEKEALINKLAKDDILWNSLSTEIDLLKRDPMFEEAARLVVQHQQGATSLIQRKLSIGYNRAGRIIDQLEAAGIIGPFEGSKARDVLISDYTYLEERLRMLDDSNSVRSYLNNNRTMQLFYEKNKEAINLRRAGYIKNQQIEADRLEKEDIKQRMLEKEREKRLHREALQELIEAGEIFNHFTNKDGKREQIPQDVMDKVWNRDGGKCVKCGSQEDLEFDHIIPVSKGGASTYRNIQLLCKKCNLEKSNKIG